MSAKKYDTGKTAWHACPWLALEQHAKVMTFGAEKYGTFNFLEGDGLSPDRYFSAMMRHVLAHKTEKARDSESGLPHLAHAASCLLMWLETELRKGKL